MFQAQIKQHVNKTETKHSQINDTILAYSNHNVPDHLQVKQTSEGKVKRSLR